MNVKEMIEELRNRGYVVEARKRKDGGYIITKINGQTFKGAKGNTYARSVLGVELSQARMEQLSFNVNKYISGANKKATLDQEMKKELRKVQRKWRKHKVKGQISASKVKRHIKESGREEALEYLRRQSRYGEGLAYEENVEYLAKYIEDVALGMREKDNELAEASLKVANFVRSKINIFKEEWISPTYADWYEVIEMHYDPNVCAQAIIKTYNRIG